MSELRRIAPDRLHPDPDVQLDWSFNPNWIKARMAEGGFDQEKAGAIDATPDGNGGYNVFWGRHRAALAKESGVRTIRVMVHDEMTVAEKHAIKLARDRDQRRVKPVETFLNEVGAGDPTAVAINEVVEMNGRTVRNRSANKQDYTIIEAIRPLQSIYREGGADLLNAVFELSDSVPEWINAPGTNEAQWLDGLAVAISEGWTVRLTPRGMEKLGTLVPRIVIKHAQGEAQLASRARGVDRAVSRLIAAKLRRTAGLRRKFPEAAAIIEGEEEAA